MWDANGLLDSRTALEGLTSIAARLPVLHSSTTDGQYDPLASTAELRGMLQQMLEREEMTGGPGPISGVKAQLDLLCEAIGDRYSPRAFIYHDWSKEHVRNDNGAICSSHRVPVEHGR